MEERNFIYLGLILALPFALCVLASLFVGATLPIALISKGWALALICGFSGFRLGAHVEQRTALSLLQKSIYIIPICALASLILPHNLALAILALLLGFQGFVDAMARNEKQISRAYFLLRIACTTASLTCIAILVMIPAI